MKAADLSPLALAALAVAIVVIGLVAGRWLSRRTDWGPAGGLALLVATPLVPHVPVAAGLSLDDILPLLGIAFLATTVDLRRLGAVKVPWLLVVGLALAIGAGIVSSLVQRDVADAGRDDAAAVTGAVRLPGHDRRAGRAGGAGRTPPACWSPGRLAVLGTAEAAVGLAGFFLPLGGLGLEPTRKFSVLYFEVPGRIAGTLGISPNFLGAIFVLTIIVTAGLAIEAATADETGSCGGGRSWSRRWR